MPKIRDKILPKQVNNEFPEYKIAQYAFVVLVFITIARSIAHIILPDGGAGSVGSFAASNGPDYCFRVYRTIGNGITQTN